MANTPSEFLRSLYEAYTDGPLFISSLPNERGGVPGERAITTREWDRVDDHLRRWDKAGRALYFCVNPLRLGESVRNKSTIGEIAAVKADIDSKDLMAGVSRDTVLAALRGTEFPPTVIIASGYGLHAYWFLTEAVNPNDAETVELVETIDRQLSDVFAGDPQVCEIARLMRLPGSHNSKHGDFIEVEVIECTPTRRYELSDLEDWLSWQSRLLHRKPSAEDRAAPKNPFTAVADRLGFKPSVDVEARLSAMSYQGSGDSSIHATQLAVSASLLSRGTPLEEVVSLLLDATRAAAGASSDRWNWRSEERAIRRMCETWLAKNPVNVERLRPRAERSNGTTGRGDDGTGPDPDDGDSATVHDLGAKRQERRQERQHGGIEHPEHVVLGEGVIEALRQAGDDLLLTRDGLHLYRRGEWSRLDEEGELRLRVLMENGARTLRMKSKGRLFSECQSWIERNPDLWVENVAWDGHGLVPAANGLVDPETGSLTPYKPEHYATWKLTVPFDPEATCPLTMEVLNETFSDRDAEERQQTVELVRDFLGSGLIQDRVRAFRRALIFYGGSNCGKSELLDLIVGLHSASPISQAIKDLDSAHGLQPFLRRAPWALHEAFDQNAWYFSSATKRLITGEAVEINVKNSAQRTHNFNGQVVWATNHPPTFREATKAIINRLIILPCRVQFDDQVPTGVAEKAIAAGHHSLAQFLLDKEGPGILNFAIEGMKALRTRGKFAPAQASQEAIEELYQENNLVVGFIKECCRFSPGHMVKTQDFGSAFAVWHEEKYGEERASRISMDRVGKALRALGDARIGLDKDTFRTERDRFYGGLALNDSGIDYWRGSETARAAEGLRTRRSTAESEVNRPVPEAWMSRPGVIRMQAAHRSRATDTPHDRPDDKARKPLF